MTPAAPSTPAGKPPVRPSIDDVLRQLDPIVIRNEIAELRAQAERIAAEIAKRQQILDVRRRFIPDDPAEAAKTTGAEGISDDTRTEGKRTEATVAQEGDGVTVVRDFRAKERILADVLYDAPEGLHLRDVRRELEKRRIRFDGTPERGVLWRMEKEGVVEKVRPAVYRLRMMMSAWDPERAMPDSEG